MKFSKHQLVALACAAMLVVQVAHADDTELLISPASGEDPNAMLRNDSFTAMATQAGTMRPYESAQRYAGSCDSNAIYWTDVDATPDCSTTRNVIDKRDFLCSAATEQLAVYGRSSNMLAQYRNGGGDGDSIGPYRWQFLAPGHANSPVDCRADHGIHGDGRGNYRWPAAGSNVSDPFTTSEQRALSWGSTPRNRRYSVYDGNYLNWKQGVSDKIQARSESTQSATNPVADSLSADSCVITDTASFTQPTIAVSPFNRTRHLNDVYLSTFDVRSKTHWPGRLRKYRFQGQGIDDSRDLWDLQRDGAAPRLPGPSARRLYSNIVSNDLTVAGNEVIPGNEALSATVLGLTGAQGEPDLDELLDWIRGANVQKNKHTVGDALHAQPAAVVYGGSASDPDTVVYTATNNGYLHAVSGRDGEELWAFIPEQILANQTRLYLDPDAWHKQYALDGNIVPVTKDVDRDGVIEADDGDFVYLIFGMRRGGQAYFALDVTDKHAPSLLWMFDSNESGESWSTPSVARMHVAGALQNADKAVVVIGGGYDTVHDTAAHPVGADGSGAGIHILDLISGERLWRAGMDAGANLLLNAVDRAMNRAIPNRIRVIDLNSDGLADRMYASDLGGQIWRFDIDNGRSANQLVAGGVIAQLGANGLRTRPSAAQTRRFYNAPDVSLITDVKQQKRFLAISIGSGYRAHPLDASANDRFFSLRDPDVFQALSQQDYDNYDVITEHDLVEAGRESQPVVSADDRGWMLTLPDNEKILADSLTFDDHVFVVSFAPDSQAAAKCVSNNSLNHLYRLNVVNGASVSSPVAVQQGGIAPSPAVIFPGPDMNCSGDECSIRPLVCVGVECFDPEPDATRVRTLWAQDGID
ncbi:MAG: pilus assembly protein [Woeseiaceae bacterium]